MDNRSIVANPRMDKLHFSKLLARRHQGRHLLGATFQSQTLPSTLDNRLGQVAPLLIHFLAIAKNHEYNAHQFQRIAARQQMRICQAEPIAGNQSFCRKKGGCEINTGTLMKNVRTPTLLEIVELENFAIAMVHKISS